jgi:hypothetical protein
MTVGPGRLGPSFRPGTPMTHRLLLAALLIGVGYVTSAGAENPTGKDRAMAEVRKAVESFCEADFQALDARDSLATYSPSVRKAHLRDVDNGWPNVAWTWDPVTVVVAYRLGKVFTDDSTGSATVEFDEIARCVGRRRYVGLPRRASAVTLHLRRTGDVWRVSDPPEPRVSQNALVAIYAGQLATPDDEWFRHASVEQVDDYQSMVVALRFLKSLK